MDHVWSRNWARWECFLMGEEMPFAEYKAQSFGGPFDYAPVDPGPEQA
ncbi:hypothetical protein O9K63_02115 [Janibacter cremeus]|nr:hypothetical protein [Janibacter cremeus]WEV78615.1 hypothetical protein O9K63_02115 [Janibacter cremeus]